MSRNVELAPEDIIGELVLLADGSELDLRLLGGEKQAAVRKFIDAAAAKLAEIGKVLEVELPDNYTSSPPFPSLDLLQSSGIFGGRPQPSIINPELIVNRISPSPLYIAFLPPRSLNVEGDILKGSTVVISKQYIRAGGHTISIPHVAETTLNPKQRRVEFRGEGPYGETFNGSVSSTEDGSFTISTQTVYDREKYMRAVFEEAELPLSTTAPPL